MITVYQYGPAWGLPCISPFVSKLSYYLDLAGIPYVLKPQDLNRIDQDAPRGKLPYAVLEDGRVLSDSTEIIAALERERLGRLDEDLSRAAQADMLAWTRLCDEHLYWSGVVAPRWGMDENFERYMPVLANGAPLSPALIEGLRRFRCRILAQLQGQGMGRRGADDRLSAFKADIDAITARLAAGDFLMGMRVHSGDAGLFAMLVHIMDVPFPWPGRDYARENPVLVRYCGAMRTLLADRSRAIA